MRSTSTDPKRGLVIGLAVGFVGVLLALTVVGLVAGDLDNVGAAAAAIGLAVVIMVPVLVLLLGRGRPSG